MDSDIGFPVEIAAKCFTKNLPTSGSGTSGSELVAVKSPKVWFLLILYKDEAYMT